MSICIYGEVASDWLVSRNGSISLRMGGAGLYAALSAARLGKKVDLFTVLNPEIDKYYLSVWSDIGVSFEHAKIDKDYVHPNYIVTGFENCCKKVSRPIYTQKYDNEYFPSLPVDSEAILLFPIGHSIPRRLCEEAKNRNNIVFLDPKPNEESIEDARKVLSYVDVLLVNEEELLLLSAKKNLVEAIESLFEKGPRCIVVKRGIKGCIVAQKNKKSQFIPSYKSNAVCTLGSGDAFGGALVSTYVETGNMEYSAKFASCMVACFIESFDAERIPNKNAVEFYMKDREIVDFISTKEVTIYLAGPFFSQQELNWVNYIHGFLESCGFKILSPSKENGIINVNTGSDVKKDVFLSDLKLLDKSDLVVALLDHSDTGTSFEIGYAYSNNIPVLGLKTSKSSLNNMIEYSCDIICSSVEELITEVYKYARR